jgi:hypothetical protein
MNLITERVPYYSRSDEFRWFVSDNSAIIMGNAMPPRGVNSGGVRQSEVSAMSVPNCNISPVDSDNLKQCSKCGNLKPFVAFYRDRTKADGLQRHCIDCQKAYRKIHLAEKLAYNREWRENNRERTRENGRRGSAAYRDRNRDKVRERDREFMRKMRVENPDYIRLIRHKSRANRRKATGSHTVADLVAVRAAQTDAKGRLICWECGKPIRSTPHLDHWIPLAKGGTNDAGNLHYMHAKCNMKKNAKMPTEIGRLI